MMENYTDTELLNALQDLTKGYGDGWILRESTNGRGMRLHETGGEMPVSEGNISINVREAITNYLNEKK